jgi:hypothetical protein
MYSYSARFTALAFPVRVRLPVRIPSHIYFALITGRLQPGRAERGSRAQNRYKLIHTLWSDPSVTQHVAPHTYFWFVVRFGN